MRILNWHVDCLLKNISDEKKLVAAWNNKLGIINVKSLEDLLATLENRVLKCMAKVGCDNETALNLYGKKILFYVI